MQTARINTTQHQYSRCMTLSGCLDFLLSRVGVQMDGTLPAPMAEGHKDEYPIKVSLHEEMSSSESLSETSEHEPAPIELTATHGLPSASTGQQSDGERDADRQDTAACAAYSLDAAERDMGKPEDDGCRGKTADAEERGYDRTRWDYQGPEDVPIVFEDASAFVRTFAMGWLPRTIYDKLYSASTSMEMVVLRSLSVEMQRFREKFLMLPGSNNLNPNLKMNLRQIREARRQAGFEDAKMISYPEVDECLWMWLRQHVVHHEDLAKTAKKQQRALAKTLKQEFQCIYRLRAVVRRGLVDLANENNEKRLLEDFCNYVGRIEEDAVALKKSRKQAHRCKSATKKVHRRDAVERAEAETKDMCLPDNQGQTAQTRKAGTKANRQWKSQSYHGPIKPLPKKRRTARGRQDDALDDYYAHLKE